MRVYLHPPYKGGNKGAGTPEYASEAKEKRRDHTIELLPQRFLSEEKTKVDCLPVFLCVPAEAYISKATA